MKAYIILPVMILVLLSCRESKKNDAGIKSSGQDILTQPDEKPDNFFPVTSYIRGQLFEIKNKGINPQKIITTHGHSDSSWIKIENLEKEIVEFLSPVIDSSNLIALFSEKKFLDQTLNAYTLTYDPKNNLPDSFVLRHWDVYIDPATNKIKRIYLVKKSGEKIKQLTWLSDKNCKILTITNDKADNSSVESETTIKWDF